MNYLMSDTDRDLLLGIHNRLQPIKNVAAPGSIHQVRDGESMQETMERFVTTASQPILSGFRFGASSEKELIGVKKELVECVRRALRLTTQDFMVFDGIRSVAEQKAHVANGASKTMKSKHLDGLAVDLVPYSNGKPVWDWTLIYPVAFAMDRAATEFGVANRIRWGGAWDRTLADFGGELDDYKRECELYAERHPGKDFLDGPHFEWVS